MTVLRTNRHKQPIEKPCDDGSHGSTHQDWLPRLKRWVRKTSPGQMMKEMTRMVKTIVQLSPMKLL